MAITTPAILNDAGIDIVAGNALVAEVASTGSTINISNLNFTIIRYHMPPKFYQLQANVFESGKSIK